jgi:hypothetical protein
MNQGDASLVTHALSERQRQKVVDGDNPIGRFAVDLVVVRDDRDVWSPYAIELDLRKGGTTHPFLTMQFLTGGTYDPEIALFIAPQRARKAPGRDGPSRVAALSRADTR